MQKRGRFITFEGPEGSGKSSQIRVLARRLSDRGLRVLSTREPGGTRTGEMIRAILQHDKAREPLDPETETLLFAASRSHLVRRVILPALKKGVWVLCDRFADSTAAYQGYGRGVDVETVARINAVAVDGAVPDLTILLDLPAELGLRRLRGRRSGRAVSRDRIEREALSFHRRVRRGYRLLARRFPDRFRVIDAAQDRRLVEQAVWKAVSDVFGQRI